MILAEMAIIAHAVVVLVNVQTTCKRRLNLTSVFLFRVVYVNHLQNRGEHY